MMGKQIIAVDLGGTQLRTARYDHDLNLLQRESTLTRADLGPQATINRLIAYIDKVMPGSRDDITGIGISSPGPLNPKTGVIIAPPNLPGWNNVPLGELVAKEFGLPVFIGNDANVAALAEASKGAAQGCRHVVYITVSTGIGSGIISDGKLVAGRDGLAAELGHIPIIVEHGKVSSIELEAAGPALAGRARAALEAGAISCLAGMVAGELSRIDAKAVGLAAAEGDQLAIKTLAYAGRIIGLGIVTALLLFNPGDYRRRRRRDQDWRPTLHPDASSCLRTCLGQRFCEGFAHRTGGARRRCGAGRRCCTGRDCRRQHGHQRA